MLAEQKRNEALQTELRDSYATLEQKIDVLDLALSLGHFGYIDRDVINNTWHRSPEVFELYGVPEMADKPLTDPSGWFRPYVVEADLPALDEYLEQPRTRQPRQIDTYHIRRGDTGEIRALTQASIALFDQNGTWVREIALIQDITGQVRRTEQAERLAAARSQFVANVSHELRTPLNVIIGCGHLLEAAELKADQREDLSTLLHAGQHMLGMINDLLDHAKIEAGEFSLSTEPFELGDALTAVINVMHTNAGEKGLDLILDPLPETLSGRYIGDPLRLRQILFNLIGNAIKFTDEGQVRVTVSHLKAKESPRERIRFEVSDTGIGIPPAALNDIFKPFTQVEDVDTRTVGGTGLGLSIVRELAQRMAGEVDVRSVEGEGSTFAVEIELPIAAAAETVAHRGAETEAIDLSGLTILVVDDSSMNRKVASRILEKAGASISVAADGQQALDWLADHDGNIDAVLMDIQMPVMDGITAVTAIRANSRYNELPVIAMTAAATREDQQRGMAAGMNAYIAKPFNPDTLKAVIRDLVVRPNAPTDGAEPEPAPQPPTPSVVRLRPPTGAAVPTVTGIDMRFARARFGRNPDLFARFLTNFVRSFRAIRRAFTTADNGLRGRALTAALQTLAHSAQRIGATEIEWLSNRILESDWINTRIVGRMSQASLTDTSREIQDLLKQMDVVSLSYQDIYGQIPATGQRSSHIDLQAPTDGRD